MTTLFNILDGAVENAEMNDINITREYIEDYAENCGAYDITLSSAQLDTIWDEFNKLSTSDWYQMSLRLDIEV